MICGEPGCGKPAPHYWQCPTPACKRELGYCRDHETTTSVGTRCVGTTRAADEMQRHIQQEGHQR